MDGPTAWGPDGRYELLEVLARDGFGVVWRGRSREDAEPVAIRLAEIGGDVDPDVVEDVVAEWRRLSSIQHPALWAVRNLVVEGQTVGLVTELVEGASLRKRLASDGRMMPATAAATASDLAGALAAVHARGLVHGSVTSADVLVGQDGRVRLADLASVRLARRTMQRTGPRHGTAYDAPPYAAPEVIQGQRQVASSDVYALGIVLYEMVTGVTPYEGGSADEVLERHLDDEPVWPAGTPEGLRDLLRRCLAHDPGDRPPARAVAAELSELAEALSDAPRIARPRARSARYRRFAGYRRRAPQPSEQSSARHRKPDPLPTRFPLLTVLVLAISTLLVLGGALLAKRQFIDPDGGTARPAPSIAPTPDGEGGQPTQGPTTGPTATPVPAPGGDAPVLPVAARRNTAAGASAFVGYWFDALSMATGTGDTDAVAAASNPRCTACQAATGAISPRYANGGSLSGGTYFVRSVINGNFPATRHPSLDVVFDRTPRTAIAPDGQRRADLAGAAFAVCRVVVEWTGGRWRMLSLTSSEPLA